MQLPFAEPYKIKTVESLHRSTREERENWIRNAGYNVFNLKSNQVYIDLLTDSGTGALSDQQWSAMMTGDESYAGSRSFDELHSTIKELTGFDYLLPTHQGRAAENVLFSVLVKKGQRIPGNAHFDTTKGHIEFRQASAIDCTIREAYLTSDTHPFKGNIDIDKLEQELKQHHTSIPFIIVTATCNTVGGQPVSLENMRQVRSIADKYGKLLVLDAARFAENAYFIKMREPGYQQHTIRDIVKEMFSLFDAATMSAKKDGLVNIGGFIAMKEEALYREATVFNIMFEGYLTYGGLAGRDLAAMATGLREVTQFDFLGSRIRQVESLGYRLKQLGVEVQEPFGGHAIFIDALKILDQVKRDQFPAQTFVIELYLEGGIRSAEIGTLMADRDPVTRENRYPELEMVRLAIPRRVYTQSHMDYVAVAAANVLERSKKISRGYRIVREATIMRHFTIELAPC